MNVMSGFPERSKPQEFGLGATVTIGVYCPELGVPMICERNCAECGVKYQKTLDEVLKE